MPPFDPDSRDSRSRTDLLVSLGFLVLAGTLMILPPEGQQTVSSALRSSVLAPFIWTQESLNESRARAADVEVLQARLDSLAAELMAREALAEENRRLRELLELQERADHGFVPATAIRPGTRGSESMFLLNVGSRHGVGENDPVVSAAGLVGLVRNVNDGAALAMEWTHPDFRVSVMTAEGEAFGIVEPVPGPFREQDRMILTGIPYHTLVPEGTRLLTSGLGGVSGLGSIYPRGIPVGVVEGVAEVEAGWRRSYRVRPAAEPGGLTHVLVLTAAAGMEEVRARVGTLWDEAGGSR
jgi:rod shape-determining protein MreC